MKIGLILIPWLFLAMGFNLSSCGVIEQISGKDEEEKQPAEIAPSLVKIIPADWNGATDWKDSLWSFETL